MTEPSPTTVVLGSFRGGTSCVAGTLHQLGVVMGRKMRRGNIANRKGFFEAPALAAICRSAYHEPSMRRRLEHHDITARLHGWIQQRRQWAAANERIGAKHPTLCLMVPHVLAVWGPCRFVRVIRPVEESSASLRRAGWYRPKHQQRLPRILVEARDAALAEYSAPDHIIDVHLHDLLRDPAGQVDRLCEFLDLDPTPAQLAAARSFPDRGLTTATTAPA